LTKLGAFAKITPLRTAQQPDKGIMAERKGKQAARRVPTRTKTFVSARPQESRPGAAKPSSTGSRYSVQSLLLGLDVLEALAFAAADRGVTELASQLGTTKWRIFRHLHSLTEAGYVNKDPTTSRFRIGRRTYSLIEALPHRFNFAREARAEMSVLRDKTSHSVVLAAAVDDTGVVVVDAIEGKHAVQFNLKVGAIFDLHASAHGKAALAFGPSEWLERVIARGLPRHTECTITDPRLLRREIERIRNQGWASAFEESFRGVNTVVAPIFSARNYVGTIAIFGSIEAIPRNPNPKDVEAVKTAAQHISQKLGWK
jgi:IclR family transcriptional regulator, KDG regulon repressor